MADTVPHRRLARLPRIDQWSPGIRPTWAVEQVKSALYEHQSGDFSQSSLLVEAMYADDELPTSLDRAVNLIVGSDFSLLPIEDEDGEPEPDSEAQAKLLFPIWEDCFPEHELAKMIRWFVMLGVAVGVIDWDTRGPAGLWKPRLRTLHPEFLWWDDSTKDPQTGLWGVFRYNSRDNESEIVTPGDGRWVLLSDGRESWMRCSLRALATTWLVKQFAWRDWQRYNERHGLPIVKAMVPTVADAPDKSAFFNSIKAMNSETVALLPIGMDENGLGYDLDLLEAKDQSWDTFRSVIERCDRKIQIHFLGTNTNELIGTAGSRAVSETGRNISSETANERARRITTDLRDQLVKPFSAFNVPGADLELAPWPYWNIDGEEDAQKRAEGMKAFADALKSLNEAGWDVVSIEEEAKRFGLKLKEREDDEPEHTEPVDSVPVPGNGDVDGAGDSDDAGGQGGEEQLAALAQEAPVSVEDVGRRDGFVAGQRYLDGLTDQLTNQADALEKVSAEAMVDLIGSATSPDDLKKKLTEYATGAAPIELAQLFEKAILLSSLAGAFAVEEDL